MTDSRYINCKANQHRIILEDGLLLSKCFGETGSVKNYQIFIPKQQVKEVLRNLHGKIKKQPGLAKTLIAYKEKYYFPKKAQLSGSGSWHVSNASENPEKTVVSPRPLQNHSELITAPEDAMQIDLVRELPPSRGYENIVTAIDVFPALYLRTRHQIRKPRQLLKV